MPKTTTKKTTTKKASKKQNDVAKLEKAYNASNLVSSLILKN